MHLQSFQLFYTYVCNSVSIDTTDCLTKLLRENLEIVTDLIQRSFVNKIYIKRTLIKFDWNTFFTFASSEIIAQSSPFCFNRMSYITTEDRWFADEKFSYFRRQSLIALISIRVWDMFWLLCLEFKITQYTEGEKWSRLGNRTRSLFITAPAWKILQTAQVHCDFKR